MNVHKVSYTNTAEVVACRTSWASGFISPKGANVILVMEALILNGRAKGETCFVLLDMTLSQGQRKKEIYTPLQQVSKWFFDRPWVVLMMIPFKCYFVASERIWLLLLLFPWRLDSSMYPRDEQGDTRFIFSRKCRFLSSEAVITRIKADDSRTKSGAQQQIFTEKQC